MSKLRAGFEPGGVIVSESEQKRFIRLFGAILRLRNILTSFDDFADADVLDVGELDALISEERLKAEPTRRLVAAALAGLARIGVEGTAVSRILPPMSRFRRTAGSDTLDTKKHRVADELVCHVDRFSGLLGVSPEIHVAE